MPDAFTRLKSQLKSVDDWLPGFLKLSLTKKERALAISLQKYIAHCYRDEQKWRSESAAEDAMIKISGAWHRLYAPHVRKD